MRGSMAEPLRILNSRILSVAAVSETVAMLPRLRSAGPVQLTPDSGAGKEPATKWLWNRALSHPSSASGESCLQPTLPHRGRVKSGAVKPSEAEGGQR
jgi:hypothetical protein